jgi:serine/threonine protein kinase
VFDFGLGDFGAGIFLIFINLLVFALVLKLAFDRHRRLEEEKQWRQPLTTQQLLVVEKVMNEGFLKSTTNSSLEGNLSADKMFQQEVGNNNIDEDGIELSSSMVNMTSMTTTETSASRKSIEEIDQISSEVLTQYSLTPKVIVMSKRVGAGAFGEVFKGTCMGETVAIKTMIDVTEANVREFKAEIILTATLRHPNIVNFVGACWGKELMCLVLEWVAKGSLRDLLQARDLKWDDPLLKLASDMARGMNYLHNRKYYDERAGQTVACIIHRDLKPDNALISEYIAAKLADFGTSRSKADDEDVTMTAVGTPLYCAPEIARGEKYDESVDVYSFGLTLLEMAVEQPLLDFIGDRWMVAFDKKKAPKQAMRLIRPMTEDGWRPVTKDNPVQFAPPTINKLIIECCDHDASRRPSFEHILERLGDECKNEIESLPYARRLVVEKLVVADKNEGVAAVVTKDVITGNPESSTKAGGVVEVEEVKVDKANEASWVVQNPFATNTKLKRQSSEEDDRGTFL